MFSFASSTLHRYMDVEGTRVYYRESVPDSANAPVLVLLHGFPSSSHQFRQLMTVMGARYRIIAPDYPGFGFTETPRQFTYTFDQLAGVIESFIQGLRLDRFIMYVFDFGAPVGFRIAERRPEWIAGLIIQNGNAYEEGLSEAASKALLGKAGDAEAEAGLRDLLTLAGTRYQYEAGVLNPESIAPESWTLDQHFMELPGRKDAHLALFFDYSSNIESYGRWQAWLRSYAPPTIVIWGARDPFFVAAGARAYLRDMPQAELHLFETGHFALETHLREVVPLLADFLDRNWK
jgi:pimeloyl-ACP methyl ester carboxylesterase